MGMRPPGRDDLTKLAALNHFELSDEDLELSAANDGADVPAAGPARPVAANRGRRSSIAIAIRAGARSPRTIR